MFRSSITRALVSKSERRCFSKMADRRSSGSLLRSSGVLIPRRRMEIFFPAMAECSSMSKARYFDVGIKFILCLLMSGTSGQQQNSEQQKQHSFHDFSSPLSSYAGIYRQSYAADENLCKRRGASPIAPTRGPTTSPHENARGEHQKCGALLQQ